MKFDIIAQNSDNTLVLYGRDLFSGIFIVRHWDGEKL